MTTPLSRGFLTFVPLLLTPASSPLSLGTMTFVPVAPPPKEWPLPSFDSPMMSANKLRVQAAFAESFMPPVSDNCASRCYAYALINPPSHCLGYLLRCAIEGWGDHPTVGLAASDYGAMLVKFCSPEVRESTFWLFPIDLDGHHIVLERSEDGENRFCWQFSCFAQVTATGFPLEHCDNEGICCAFCSVGNVCCIDHLCLGDVDCSAVPLVLRLEDMLDVPRALLLQDAEGKSSSEVKLRLVHAWPLADDATAGHASHFGWFCGLAFGNLRVSHLDDIDTISMRAPSPPPPPPVHPHAPASAIELLHRIAVRHAASSLATPPADKHALAGRLVN